MRILSWTTILLVNTLFLSSTPSQAASPNSKRLSIQPRTAVTLSKPDLMIQNVTYGAQPKAGDRIGATTIFNIQVRNAGNAAAPGNRLKITCTPLGAASCAPELSGSLSVSPLAPNGQYGLTWPPMSQSKWAAGRYRLTFEVDADHAVVEKQEGNNVRSLIINVPGLPALSMANREKPKLSKPSLVNKLKDCSLRDIKITSPQDYSIHYLADNVTVKWSSTSDKTCKLAVNLRRPGAGLTWQTENTGSYTFKPPVTLIPSQDLGDAYTVWLSPPNNTQQQLAKTRILLKKPTAIPPGACSGAESCPAFNDTWTDLKPTGFAVSYPSTTDTIHFQIRWKNTGPQCLPVVRWRITENGRGIKEGSYIAGGASATSFSVLGCQEMMIEGAVRKSDFKYFSKCQNSSDQCSKALFTIDSDNSVVETDENNNMKIMVFRWPDPWPQ